MHVLIVGLPGLALLRATYSAAVRYDRAKKIFTQHHLSRAGPVTSVWLLMSCIDCCWHWWGQWLTKITLIRAVVGAVDTGHSDRCWATLLPGAVSVSGHNFLMLFQHLVTHALHLTADAHLSITKTVKYESSESSGLSWEIVVVEPGAWCVPNVCSIRLCLRCRPLLHNPAHHLLTAAHCCSGGKIEN